MLKYIKIKVTQNDFSKTYLIPLDNSLIEFDDADVKISFYSPTKQTRVIQFQEKTEYEKAQKIIESSVELIGDH